MKGFYHIWAWQPSWSCDLDFLYTHWFPLPIYASYKIWLWLAKRFQRRRSLKLWTDGRRTDGRTDGRTPDHGHPLSSPCEPDGSGELKIGIPLQTDSFMMRHHLSLRKHAHVIYSNFFRSKIDNFQRKIFDIFLIFAQNIDCVYTLEPPR